MSIKCFFILLLCCSFFASCTNKNGDREGAVNVLANVDFDITISDVLSKKIFSLDNMVEFDSFDLDSRHYGNIVIDGMNNKKLKRSRKLKYSREKTKLPFFIKPLIVDEKIYVLDMGGGLVAYDRDTKEILWRVKLAAVDEYNSLRGGIRYDAENLYVTFGTNKLFSIDAKSGDVLWEKKFNSLLREVPYIYDKKLYVMTLNNKLYCLSVNKGEIIWADNFLDALSSQFGNSGFNHRGSIMSYGNSNGEIVVFVADTGEVIWKENIGSMGLGIKDFNFYDVDVMPIIFDKKLYTVSSNGKIAAFEYISGVKLWEQKLSSRKTPWVTNDLIFVIDVNNYLIALSRNSGKVKWYSKLDKAVLPKKENKFFYGPVVVNGKVFVSNNLGRLSAFDYNSGELLLNYKIPKNINHFPFINSDKLYMINNKSVLYEYQ